MGDGRATIVNATAAASLALTATLYLATMNRSIGFIDRGELAAVATTLGIAHPTGYPTCTLLGYAAVKLVPWSRPILVLNALSALWTALAVALTTTLVHEIVLALWNDFNAGDRSRARRRS